MALYHQITFFVQSHDVGVKTIAMLDEQGGEFFPTVLMTSSIAVRKKIIIEVLWKLKACSRPLCESRWQVIGQKNHLKLYQDKFKLDSRKNAFVERVFKHWNVLTWDVVQSPSLEVFNKCMDMTLRDMV